MKPHEASVGATVEWYTPPEIFERLDAVFDLDPASPGKDVVPWVPARRHYTREDDGLSSPWDGYVWLNPPYGPEAVAFADKMADHGNGLLLLPARTETRMFQRMLARCWMVCFIAGRIHFIGSDGSPAKATTFGSALFAFGGQAVAALTDAKLGHLA